MAAAAVAALPPPSSTQLYQQAIALLRQNKFEHALLTAKKALDGAGSTVGAYGTAHSSSNGEQQQQLLCAKCWQAMAVAASGMEDIEVAYCLYAKGAEQFGKKMMMTKMMPPTQPAAPVAGSSSSSEQQNVDDLHSTVQQLIAGKLQMLAALCQSPTELPAPQQQQQHNSTGTYKRWQRLKDRFQLSSSSSNSTSLSRIFCVSDLHVDKSGGGNMSWLRSISSSRFRNDVIIVAGDVADTAAAVAAAFRILAARFQRVIWVPGNHELWMRSDSQDAVVYPDSIAKLLALWQIADECGVDVGPVELSAGIIILPLLSWYNTHFDTTSPRPGRYRHDSFCSWPVPDEDVWQVMLKLNSTSMELVRNRAAELQQQQAVDSPYRKSNIETSPIGNSGISSSSNSSVPDTPGVGVVEVDSSGRSSSSSRVSWSTEGCLAVKSMRQVPGLQLNLQPTLRRHTNSQQQQVLHGTKRSSSSSSSAAAAAAAVAAVEPQLLQQQQQQQHSVVDAAAAFRGAATHSHPAAAGAAAAAVPDQPVSATVITVSHFLPHPQLPHSRFTELSKAMGCCELQLQLDQVCSQVHVYGHSHINTDTLLPTAPALAALTSSTAASDTILLNSSSSSSSGNSRRYVQYALDAVGPATAGLYCLWDGQELVKPGCVVPIS